MTYHTVIDFPDATKAAQLRAFVAAHGGRVRSEFSRVRLEDLNDPRVISGWKSRVEGVPVYLAVGGPIRGVLPAGTRVLESESHTTAEGKRYFRHDSGEIPGLVGGWSLAINFDPPKAGDPPRSAEPLMTWPLETVTNLQILNAMNGIGMMGSIPRPIFKEMTTGSNRQAFYFTLNSKLPLEQWGLRPDRLERVRAAWRKAGIIN